MAGSARGLGPFKHVSDTRKIMYSNAVGDKGWQAGRDFAGQDCLKRRAGTIMISDVSRSKMRSGPLLRAGLCR
jgi:hypothetical protein